jgi:hypothetical protein
MAEKPGGYFEWLFGMPYEEYSSREWSWGKCCYTARAALAPLNTPYLTLAAWSFIIALVFSPFRRGVLMYILFLVVYEVAVYISCRGTSESEWCSNWESGERALIVLMSLLGFVLGICILKISKERSKREWSRLILVCGIVGAITLAVTSPTERMTECIPPSTTRAMTQSLIVVGTTFLCLSFL